MEDGGSSVTKPEQTNGVTVSANPGNACMHGPELIPIPRMDLKAFGESQKS